MNGHFPREQLKKERFITRELGSGTKTFTENLEMELQINIPDKILRKVENRDYEELFNIEDTVEKISKTTSMPEWIVKKLLEQKSKEEVEQICKNSNQRPKTSTQSPLPVTSESGSWSTTSVAKKSA